MTTDSGGPRGPASAAARAVRDLDPGCFAVVMATGIVSTGAHLAGPSWLSLVLLVIAAAGFAVLAVMLAARLVLFRPQVAADLRAPERAFPLAMYSAATLTFGKAAHLTFMAPLARFMFWAAFAAWLLVAAGFVRSVTKAPATPMSTPE